MLLIPTSLLVGLLLGAQLVYGSPAGTTHLVRRTGSFPSPESERSEGHDLPDPTDADEEYLVCIAKWCRYQAQQELNSPDPFSIQARQEAFNHGERACFELTRVRWGGQEPERHFRREELDEIIEEAKVAVRNQEAGEGQRSPLEGGDTNPLMMQVNRRAGMGSRGNVLGMGMDRVNSVVAGMKHNVQGLVAARPHVNLPAIAAVIQRGGWASNMAAARPMGWVGRPMALP